MKSITMHAPAKINYRLDVIRKRDDGYHDLRMVMQRINLCDIISIKLTDNRLITVKCGHADLADGENNIAFKAAKAIFEIAAGRNGAEIEISKNIPIAAGLGGGSSDAATVLMAMNELLKLELSDQRLMEIGLKLGADVPFFIFKQTALAEGIGEQLTPMPKMPKLSVLLVNPGIHVSTAWVYNSLQLTSKNDLDILPQMYGGIEDVCSILSNDLETVTIPAFPLIAEIKNIMLSEGAAGAMMSGSGSTVFGLFADRQAADKALSKFKLNSNWFSAVVETI